jgi:hypothetical protein
VVVFASGVAVALIFPENGTYEFAWLGDGVGTIREALRYSVGFLQAGFNSFGVARPSPMPLLFVAFPLFGCALGAYLQMGRTTGLKRHQRLAWGALVGVPFAVVMRILAAGMGHDLTAKSSQTFWLALVWGSIGGLAGARWALRGELASESSGVLPGAVTRVVHAAGTAVKPLAVLVGVLGIIGAAVWVVQDVRNIPSASHASEGSAPPKSSAVIQDILYVGEHGVRLTELGSGTRFVYRYGNRGTGYPIPVKHTEKIDHRTGDADSSGFGFRIFNYSHALKPYVFVPVLIGLLGGLAFFALFAGFSTARAAGATDVRQGAWWGASVGVIWAAAMSALEALARIESPFDPNGFASGDSVFLTFLIAGSALGALGGFLALRNAPALAPAPTDPIAEGAQ